MHETHDLSNLSKAAAYDELTKSLTYLLADERDAIANCANSAALLYYSLPEINWAGFYFLRSDELLLGPFQGKPACIRIAVGKGVCGTAAQERQSQVVPDVHEFPGHIACDADSRSEIVIPILAKDGLIGVLDVDSPLPGRFDAEDRLGLEKFVAHLITQTDF